MCTQNNGRERMFKVCINTHSLEGSGGMLPPENYLELPKTVCVALSGTVLYCIGKFCNS